MKGDGGIYRRSSRWWISYYVDGQRCREPGGDTEEEAQKKLRRRLRQAAGGQFSGPREERIRVKELMEALERDLERRGAKSMVSFRAHKKAVIDGLGSLRAVAITPQVIEEFETRQGAERINKKGEKRPGKAPATINRYVETLRQAFNLARKQGRLGRVPYFPTLAVDNARQGFFETAEIEALVAALPEAHADAVRFAYLSGWRRGEIMPLTWEQVDRSAHEVRLYTSKNGHPRVLPLEGELWNVIERCWARREFQNPDGSAISPLVFHENGRVLGDFRKRWATACKAAKVPGRLFHDLRRSAVRDMIRSGVPQSVAMSISGHRSTSIFLRYDIASDADRREALRRTQAHREAIKPTAPVVSISVNGHKTGTK
jgi:integrase